MSDSTNSELTFSVPKLKGATKPTIRIKRLSFQRPLPDAEPWGTEFLIDETYLSLMNVREKFCMLVGPTKEARMDDLRNLGRGVNMRLYEEQARYKMYRIPVFRPPPDFVIYLKHLDDRVKRELASLEMETRDFVIREAIGRIFCQVDRRFFLLSVKSLLKWRLDE